MRESILSKKCANNNNNNNNNDNNKVILNHRNYVLVPECGGTQKNENNIDLKTADFKLCLLRID